MSEADIVRMEVSLAGASTPTVANLNTPLIAAYHTHFADRARTYATASALSQMVADGFSVNEAAYKEVGRITSLANAPGTLVIGRRANMPLQTLNLACVDGTVNDAYGLTLVGSDGKAHNLAYTNIPNPGPALVGSALSGTVTVTNGSNALTFSGAQTLAAGQLINFSNQAGYSYTVAASTTASTVATLTGVFTGATASGVTATPGATTAVTSGSTSVTFSANQTLLKGALLTFSSQPGVYYALSANVTTSTAGTLTSNYTGATAAAAQTTALAPLAGTFATVNGSATVATTSSQLAAVFPGDSVEFASQLGVSYTALSLTSTAIVLTQPYTGTGAGSTNAAAVCTCATASLALAAQIAPLTGLGTVSVITSVAPSPNIGAAATLQLARTDGALTDVQNWCSNGFASLQLTDVTADPGVTADLVAIRQASDAWYGLCLDSNSAAEIESAVAWIETTGVGGKVGFFNSSDYGNTLTSVTSDVLSVLKLDGYVRSIVQQNDTQLLSYGGASLCGNLLARNPGSYAGAFQTEPGVPADTPQTLTEGQQLALNSDTAATPGSGGKNGNWYANVAGENVLFPGVTPSGRFFDITVFVDWLQVTMQQRIFGVLTSAASAPGKVPYTNIGLGLFGDAIGSVLRLGSTPAYGGIVPDGSDPTRPIRVTVVDVSTIDSADRANRNVPAGAITWSAGLTGAAQTVTVQGTLVE